jgi:hypothetical protein
LLARDDPLLLARTEGTPVDFYDFPGKRAMLYPNEAHAGLYD